MEPNDNTTLGKLLTSLTIAGLMIGAIFWVANVNATATHADSLSQQNQAEIQKKADREELREMRQDIKDIRDFLMNKGVPK